MSVSATEIISTAGIPAVPQSPALAKRALIEMERELGTARTYEDIRRIEAWAELLKKLFAGVEEVRLQAEQTIVLASHRIGEELRKPPVAKGGQPYQATGTAKVPVAPTLAQQVGSKNRGLRLKGLGEAPREVVTRTIKLLQAKGVEATVGAVLKTLKGDNKAERRQERLVELSDRTRAAAKTLGAKRYNVIYADPPWRFEPYSRETGMDRAADNHYPTMTNAEIAALAMPAADDCVLFLWATIPMLDVAIDTMRIWGFQYKSNYVWVKDRIGTGYWVREQHEHLLIGTKGLVPAPAPGENYSSVISAARQEHSRKPFCVYEMIEEMYPSLSRIEMFQRTGASGSYPPGWDVWGAESDV